MENLSNIREVEEIFRNASEYKIDDGNIKPSEFNYSPLLISFTEYHSNHSRRQDGFPVHIQDCASSLTRLIGFIHFRRRQDRLFIQVKHKNAVDETE